ncbi:MAG: hypothetical protein AAFQ07_00215 [Chloroflexota bacterium]
MNSQTGYMGVNLHLGKYDAHIGKNGRKIHLGRFVDRREAALMYDCAARMWHGDFACLNLPEIATPAGILERFEEVQIRYPELSE